MTLRSSTDAQLEAAWAAARRRLEQEPEVSTLDLAQEARARGADLLEAGDIASQLSVERLVERYGGEGAKERLGALGMAPQELAQLATNIDPFRGHVFGDRPADTVENRLATLVTSRRIDLAARIRADVAIVKQSETADVPAHARFLLDKQAREASARLEAMCILLGIPREALIGAVDARSIHPARADALIEQVFGAEMPAGTSFDRAEKRIQIVPAEIFAEHYRSLSQAGAANPADRVPMLHAANAILVPIDQDRFGSGAVASIALLEYADPELSKRFGPLLAGALADHLALELNEPFGRRSNVIEGGITGGGAQIFTAVEGAVGRDALVEGFFRDPAALHAALEARFGSSVFERLSEMAARCVTDVGYVLGASEVEALLRDQARLVGAERSGVSSSDLERVRVALAKAPATGRVRAATELAVSLGADGLASLSDPALALIAALPLRSEELYCLAEGPNVDFLERHQLGYAFRQLQRQQEEPASREGLALLATELGRRSRAKREDLLGASKPPDSDRAGAFAQSYVPALEAAIGPLHGLEGARVAPASDLVWADPSGDASDRRYVVLDQDSGHPRVVFSEDADLQAMVGACLTLSASPELAKAAGSELARLALDQFVALRLDHLLSPDTELFLSFPVPSAGSGASRIFHRLDDAVEAAAQSELGPSADLSAIERKTAERWAKILFGGDVEWLRTLS